MENYQISIHLMLLFISEPTNMVVKINNFNTSHVTVYHAFSKNIVKQMIFQYISCYCLSKNWRIWNWDYRNFNTSHVTVYRCSIFVLPAVSHISIHLMLLFIRHLPSVPSS